MHISANDVIEVARVGGIASGAYLALCAMLFGLAGLHRFSDSGAADAMLRGQWGPGAYVGIVFGALALAIALEVIAVPKVRAR